MEMDQSINNKLHIIRLVIKKLSDIPKVRAKAKTVAELLQFPRLARTQIATAASEATRMVLILSKGGLLDISAVPGNDHGKSALFLSFQGAEGMNGLRSASESTLNSKVISGIKAVMDEVSLTAEPGTPLSLEFKKSGSPVSWHEFPSLAQTLREELFKDTEELAQENLKAKHEEVLRLLKELSHKNHELNKANRELLQLSNDLEALAHERTVAELGLRIADKVRNPAMVIGGLARTLLKKAGLDEDLASKLQAIFKEAAHLEKIVREFESLALTQQRFLKSVDLRKLLVEVIKTWSPALAKKKLKVKTRFAPEPVKITANPQTLKVAILHILRNSSDASPEGGTIVIEAGRKENRPFLTVQDSGPGIPKEIMDKLFKASVSTKPAGTGLGMLLVKHIVEEHQAEIKIDTRPGTGTRVSILFPARWRE